MRNHPERMLVTEWEESILFDPDDPDFYNSNPPPPLARDCMNEMANSDSQGMTLTFRFPTTMSLASVHGPQFADLCTPLGRSSISVSSSLSDLVGSPLEISMDNVLTIEELRSQMGSCFTCGVQWTDDHVSLDCSECGGYSLERPCPLCDGKCGVLWKRDFTMSHACSKARWQGACPLHPDAIPHLNLPQSVAAIAAASNASANAPNPGTCASASQLRLAQELCARLEQLSASAQT